MILKIKKLANPDLGEKIKITKSSRGYWLHCSPFHPVSALMMMIMMMMILMLTIDASDADVDNSLYGMVDQRKCVKTYFQLR